MRCAPPGGSATRLFFCLSWPPQALSICATLPQSISLSAFFALVGSASYIINDLADLISDRRHPAKRRRGLASGRAANRARIVPGHYLDRAGFCHCASSIACLCPCGPVLSRIDAQLFLLAETVAGSGYFRAYRPLSEPPYCGRHGRQYRSHLLGSELCGPFFLGFAILNRYVELEHGQAARPGRPNLSDDLPMLASFGIAAGYMSVFVIALYSTTTDAALTFRTPEMLWLICPLIMYALSKA